MSRSTTTTVGFDNLPLQCTLTETVRNLYPRPELFFDKFEITVGMFVGTYTMRISLDDKGSQNAPLGHTAYIQAEAPNLPLSPPENPRLHSKQHTDGNDKTSRGPGWQTEDKNDESPTGGHIRAVAKGSGAQADRKDCKFSVCTAPAIVLNPPQTLCFSITTYRAGAAV